MVNIRMVKLKKILQLGTMSIIIIILLAVAFLGPISTAFPPTIKDKTKRPESLYYSTHALLPHNQTDIWVLRSVYISEFWYIKVIDTINVTNKDDRPFNSIIIYYPLEFWRLIDTFLITGSFKDDAPQPLNYTILYLPKDYVALKVLFYVALTKYSDAEKNAFKVYVTFYLKSVDILEFETVEDKIYVALNITPGPYLQHYINNYVTMIYSPDDPTISLEVDRIKPTVGKEIIEDRIVKYTKDNIKPMNLTLDPSEQLKTYGFDSQIRIVWSLKNGTPVIRYAHRTIEITQSFKIKIHDHLVVSIASFYAPELNPKKTKMSLSEFRVGLATNATDISVRDNIGKLDYGNTTDKDINETIRVIRVDLKTRPLVPGDVRDIYIDYEIPLTDKMLLRDNNTFIVYIPLAPIVNTSFLLDGLTIKTAVPITLVFPTTYKNKMVKFQTEKFFLVQYTSLTYSFGRILPYQNGLVTLLIDYHPLSLIRSYIILTLYVIIGSLIILEILFALRLIAKRVIAPKQMKAIAELERFIKAYETIIAYDKNLWGETYTNLLLKRPTPQFLDELGKKSDNLHQQYLKLVPLINKLKKDPTLFDYLIELEKIEEFIKLLKMEIVNLTREFLGGKVNTDIYKSRAEALLLNLKDQINSRERIINTIRDYYLSLI